MSEEVLIDGEISTQLIGMTVATVERLLKLPDPGDAIALYTFYALRAKQRDGITIWCTNNYTAKGLKWGLKKVVKNRKLLMDLGLLTQCKRIHKPDGSFGKSLVKIRYVAIRNTDHYTQNGTSAENAPEVQGTGSINKEYLNSTIASIFHGVVPSISCNASDSSFGMDCHVDHRDSDSDDATSATHTDTEERLF